MKKLFTVLAVLLVATALFAQVGLTVKAGGAFGFANYKSVAEGKDNDGNTKKFEELLADKALVLKTNGFGFDVGVQYDITDKIMAYVDFNMLFPGDVKVNAPDVLLTLFVPSYGDEELIEKYFTEDELLRVYSVKGMIADMKELAGEDATLDISAKNSFFSVSAGAAYKFDFKPVKLAIGGGVTLNKASAKYSVAYKDEEYSLEVKYNGTLSFTTIGLNAMVDAKYMVAQNIGVGVTLMPQVGLYNKAVFSMEGEEVFSLTAKGFKVNFAMPIVVGVSYTF